MEGGCECEVGGKTKGYAVSSTSYYGKWFKGWGVNRKGVGLVFGIAGRRGREVCVYEALQKWLPRGERTWVGSGLLCKASGRRSLE